MSSDTETTLSQLQHLVRRFPALRNAPGADPFDATKLDAWAAGPCSHGEKCSAQFILALFSHTGVPDCPWASGGFDVMEALSVWGEKERTGFLSWALEPWWP